MNFSALEPGRRHYVLGWINRLCSVILDAERLPGERITASGLLTELEQRIELDLELPGWATEIIPRPSEDVLPLVQRWISDHRV